MWKSVVAPAVVVSICWLLVGGATTYYLFSQGDSLDRLLEENVTSIRAANEMQNAMWRMHSSLMSSSQLHATPTQPVGQASSVDLASIKADEDQFSQSLIVAATSAKSRDEQQLVERIRVEFADYLAQRNQLPSASSSTTLQSGVSAIVEHCKDLVLENELTLQQASRRRQQLTVWIVCGRIAMLIIGPSLGLYMGFRLARQLRRSMANISVSLQSVAGDLQQEIGTLEVSQDADLPAIQRHLDVIADRMRRVVQELHQARRDTMRAERLAAVGELAAGVAHELRNPLTSVKLLIQTAQHRQSSTMPQQTFDIVLEEISRMETTIQGLLDFARPPKPHRALHDLRQIVRRAVNLTEGKAGQNGVVLSLDFPVESVWVNADAEQLHQVCINLLLNGIEAMPQAGALRVQIASDHERSLARIHFEDEGVGIPESILPRLFEPFTTSKDHGTGLGLAVSRRIIMNHSGQLTAENRAGGGAVVTIELPLTQDTEHRVDSNAHPLAG
jgi:signal transduction histidine kinase